MTFHAGPEFADAADEPAFPDLLTASEKDISLIIRDVIFETDINDDPVEQRVFYDALLDSFDRLRLDTESRINLLSEVQDYAPTSSLLFDLALTKAVNMIDDTEGDLPRTAYTNGRDFKLP